MALIICYVIACVQILGAGYNLWGFDPRIVLNFSLDRNSFFIALFLTMQILGLAGGLLMFARARLGLQLSIFHHLLLMPMLLFTSSRFVLLTDDLVNASLFYVSKPSGTSVAFYWSLGWNSVFEQVTRGVPRGSVFIGINLFALACAVTLWVIMRQMDAARAEEQDEYEYEDDDEEAAAREMEMLRREQQRARRRPPEPAPERYPRQDYPDYDYPQYPQQQRTQPQPRMQQEPPPRPRPQQQRLHPQPGVRMPPRVPPRD